MVRNSQSRVPVRVRDLSLFAGRASACLRLGQSHFDVTLVSDARMRRLNQVFRGKSATTDVLSFPWNDRTEMANGKGGGFLGDIVISALAARRSALVEGHSIAIEMKQLILHGLLHLLDYDHETDDGEMNELELDLRRRLGIEGLPASEKAKSKNQKAKTVVRERVFVAGAFCSDRSEQVGE
ncbi:MAG: rRNA maturation RNase YbeY [Terriglobia bacterium]